MHFLFVCMDGEKYNITVELCAYTYAFMNFQVIRQVPGLELRLQIKALLPHQEICEVLQQNLEQLLCTRIKLRLQHTLILHKIKRIKRSQLISHTYTHRAPTADLTHTHRELRQLILHTHTENFGITPKTQTASNPKVSSRLIHTFPIACF